MMKKLPILLFLSGMLFLLPFRVTAQWVNIYSDDSLAGLDALNKDTVFAVGTNRILRTCDGGTTWQNMLQSFSFDAAEVVFPNDTTGYVSGYEKILKTTDCGLTWEAVKVDSSGNWYEKLCFPTAELGFAMSWSYNGDNIFRTTDGGQTWTSVFRRPYLYDIQMTDETTGYLAGDSLFKTTNGGISWQYIPVTGIFGFVNSLGFSDSDTGLIATFAGEYPLRRTRDGGNSWETIDIYYPFFCYSYSFFYPMDDTHYYFSGWDPLAPCGGIFYSEDGGYNWVEQKQGIGPYYLFDKMDMVSDSIGYVVNVEMGVYKTANGGFLVGIKDPEQEKDKKFVVLPNPVTDNLIIRSQESFTKGEIRIYDVHGRLIINQSLLSNAETFIPFLNFPDGMYFYSIHHDSKMLESGKFLKAKTY